MEEGRDKRKGGREMDKTLWGRRKQEEGVKWTEQSKTDETGHGNRVDGIV